MTQWKWRRIRLRLWWARWRAKRTGRPVWTAAQQPRPERRLTAHDMFEAKRLYDASVQGGR